MKIHIILNTHIKELIKKHFFIYKIFHWCLRNLPFVIKQFIYPHEYDYYILRNLKIKKIKILDIGGGTGESIISFYNINKNITVDTYEPNRNNYKFCLKLKKKYKELTVHNYAYGSNKIKRKLQIPVLNNYRLDNLSGFKKKDIIENIKVNFFIKKINFLEQKVEYSKNDKKYNFIKIDCETNFLDTVKSLSDNFSSNTIIMIETNYEIKNIYEYLKKKNDTYRGYYYLDGILEKINNYNSKTVSKIVLNKKIKNILFLNKNVFKKK